jgi:hypothetical protein
VSFVSGDPADDNGGEARGKDVSTLKGSCLAFKMLELEG